ncbi:MAG: nucleotide exchange factor GrpE [Dysgonamonadaceae bacterium]|jgi:molecular chaperone GrpE|nr:nucleotide exchange factor GrpE [Dysgonamonadaceae bacterium]
MSEKDFEKKMNNEHESADVLAEDMPKEQIREGNPEEIAEPAAITAEEELAQLKDSCLRLMAEYDNYRKRTVKEKAELIKNGGEKILVGLLPVVDDFVRALETIEKATDSDAIKEGIDLIFQKFLSFLQQNGVKPIEVIGKEFDPDFCEAVAAIPAKEEEQRGKVIDDVQTGYTLNDKVIRHAKVVVAN